MECSATVTSATTDVPADVPAATAGTAAPTAAEAIEAIENTEVTEATEAIVVPVADFTWDRSLENFQLPKRKYLEKFGMDSVIVGAYVFDDAGRLLLVQRAAGDSMPGRWEIPGGGVDEDDKSLLHAAVRELWEESGLRAQHVHILVSEYMFVHRNRLCYRYCFIMHVDGYDVKLDPKEHQAYLWVTEQEALDAKCGEVEIQYTTRNQKASIPLAFELHKKGMEASSSVERRALDSEEA